MEPLWLLPRSKPNGNNQQEKDKIKDASFFHGEGGVENRCSFLVSVLQWQLSKSRSGFHHLNMVNPVFIIHFTALHKAKPLIEFFQVKLCTNLNILLSE